MKYDQKTKWSVPSKGLASSFLNNWERHWVQKKKVMHLNLSNCISIGPGPAKCHLVTHSFTVILHVESLTWIRVFICTPEHVFLTLPPTTLSHSYSASFWTQLNIFRENRSALIHHSRLPCANTRHVARYTTSLRILLFCPKGKDKIINAEALYMEILEGP